MLIYNCSIVMIFRIIVAYSNDIGISFFLCGIEVVAPEANVTIALYLLKRTMT